jgi:uncharacterized iron-regulated membrane protein
LKTDNLDNIPVQGNYEVLRGLIQTDGTMQVATTNQLISIMPTGKLIEVLGTLHGIPADISRIGTLPNGQVVLATTDKLFTGTDNLLSWSKTDATDTTWSATAPLPPALKTAIGSHYRGTGLPLERILLDLHSGRILGRIGLWLGDAVAILFILVALSGIWMWSKTQRRKP